MMRRFVCAGCRILLLFYLSATIGNSWWRSYNIFSKILRHTSSDNTVVNCYQCSTVSIWEGNCPPEQPEKNIFKVGACALSFWLGILESACRVAVHASACISLKVPVTWYFSMVHQYMVYEDIFRHLQIIRSLKHVPWINLRGLT